MSWAEGLTIAGASIAAVLAGAGFRRALSDKRLAERRDRPSAGLRVFLREREAHASTHAPATRTTDSDESLIVHYLRLVRETTASESATLWRLGDADDLHAAIWYSTSRSAGDHHAPGPLAALIRWAANEAAIVHVDAGEPPLAAAVSLRDPHNDLPDRVVLTVNSPAGLSMDSSALRGLLTRHAEHLSSLLALVGTRRAVHRQHASASTLLRGGAGVSGKPVAGAPGRIDLRRGAGIDQRPKRRAGAVASSHA